MPAKPNSRNWNDVQTAIATVAIVTTLGLWNLFATPSKTKTAQSSEPEIPPTEPPVEAFSVAPLGLVPTAMPQVKIIFTPGAPQTTIVPQVQQQVQAAKKKKNKNKDNNSGGGSVTQTKTS